MNKRLCISLGLMLALIIIMPFQCARASSWECINRVVLCHTWRMAVYGGWIVSGDNSAGGSDHTYAMTFVPDIEHKWKL